MMKYLLAILCLLVLSKNMFGQIVPNTDTLKQLDTLLVDSTLFQLPIQDTTPQKKPIVLKGQVIDDNTREPISFATVFFEGTSTGTTSDMDGFFELYVDSLPIEVLSISSIGYSTFKRALQPDLILDHYLIELSRNENELREFVVTAGEDPVIRLMRNVIANRQRFNQDRLDNYRYEVYNKLELDLDKITKKQFEKLPLMKPFSFIFDNVDSFSAETPYLPFYLTESLSDYYYQSKPKKFREFIKAVQFKGFNNESVKQFLGTMYQDVQMFDNYIDVFDKKFISPIGNAALFYYDYKALDTFDYKGFEIIHLMFKPKRQAEQTFFGDIWVVNNVFTIQKVSMEVSKLANLNWVKNVSIFQEFTPITDSVWFRVKDKFNAQLVLMYGSKFPGFIGRKTTSYKYIDFNKDSIAATVNDPNYKTDVITQAADNVHNENYWNTVRHDTLSANERKIYAMIDTLESLPRFQRTKNVIKFLASGVIEKGPLELGPYWNVYSYNGVEGSRVRVSLGTTPQLFKNAYLNGYLAYGFKDEQYKYKASGLWLLDRHPRMYLFASVMRDIDRSTSYYDDVSMDNLVSIAVRKPGVPWKLSYVKEERLEFYKSYFSGFSHMFTFVKRHNQTVDPLPSNTIFMEDGHASNAVVSSEVGLKLRFAYKEKFLEGNYYRFSLSTKYPVLEWRFAVGLKNVLRGQYGYTKAAFSISDNVKVPRMGSFYYNVFAGKIWGTLPYLLLEVHPGNDFYYYNKYAFNMMQRFEFLSDQYVGAIFEHSLGGGIFSYIPVLKHTKIRQFWNVKAIIGRLSEDNKALNLNKGYDFKTFGNRPYLEIGTGVENILQVIRFDVVYRLLPDEFSGGHNIDRLGFFGSLRFNF